MPTTPTPPPTVRSYMDTMSDVNPVQKPEFKSKISPELLGENISPAMRVLIEAVSVIEQKVDFAMDLSIDTNTQARRTNGRVNKHDDELESLRDFVKKISSIWVTVTVIGGICVGVVAFGLSTISLYREMVGNHQTPAVSVKQYVMDANGQLREVVTVPKTPQAPPSRP